jgi:hypothetical protein
MTPVVAAARRWSPPHQRLMPAKRPHWVRDRDLCTIALDQRRFAKTLLILPQLFYLAGCGIMEGTR